MSIRTRILGLVGLFAFMALIVTTLGLVTLMDYERMNQAFSRASENAWRGEHLNHLISNTVMESRGIYLAHNNVELTGFVAGLNKNLDDTQTLLTQWQAAGPGEQKRLQPILADTVAFIALRRQLAQLGTQGRQHDAEALGVGNRADRIAFQGRIETMVAQTRLELDQARNENARFGQQRFTDFLVAALIDIALMIGLSLWLISRFITRPLRALSAAIIRTSTGDYTTVLPEAAGKDEVASVWRALATLKARAIEAERLSAAQREAERQHERELREIMLD